MCARALPRTFREIARVTRTCGTDSNRIAQQECHPARAMRITFRYIYDQRVETDIIWGETCLIKGGKVAEESAVDRKQRGPQQRSKAVCCTKLSYNSGTQLCLMPVPLPVFCRNMYPARPSGHARTEHHSPCPIVGEGRSGSPHLRKFKLTLSI